MLEVKFLLAYQISQENISLHECRLWGVHIEPLPVFYYPLGAIFLAHSRVDYEGLTLRDGPDWLFCHKSDPA